jgi:Cu-Zn family superoxide dismutase
MRTLLSTTALAAGLAVAGAAAVTAPAGAQMLEPDAQANLINTEGTTIGVAKLAQGPKNLLITLNAENLPPGWHAFHIHQTGDCSDPEAGFEASGGHLGVDEADHGFMSEGGPHAGDLPNVYVGQAGLLQVQVQTGLASLNGEFGDTILDDDGAALVIHANPDDHRTDPAGGGGDRLACGVIQAVQ